MSPLFLPKMVISRLLCQQDKSAGFVKQIVDGECTFENFNILFMCEKFIFYQGVDFKLFFFQNNETNILWDILNTDIYKDMRSRQS